jgi:uncharacterized damage-inducible protein DinB
MYLRQNHVMVEREEPAFLLPERQMLEGWLELHRSTLMRKCDGLSDGQLRERAVPPSSMSLLGLVRHMADVEQNWFRRVLSREDVPGIFWSPENVDGDFDDVDTASTEEAFTAWRRECDNARAVAARMQLDDTGLRYGNPCSLRWVYAHMIEEYARHNGHADLLRERIDGATGE